VDPEEVVLPLPVVELVEFPSPLNRKRTATTTRAMTARAAMAKTMRRRATALRLRLLDE